MWTRNVEPAELDVPGTQDFVQFFERQLERERLFRSEAEHRLANFLQVAAANLDRQTRRMAQADARDAITLASDQLLLLSRLHHVFSQIDCSSLLAYGKGLAEACTVLHELAFAPRGHVLRFVLQAGAEDIAIRGDQAQALTLLTSELILNAAKHGFAERQSGTVEVLLGWGSGHITCAVIDNGGMSSARQSHSDSQGMLIASRLAKEVGGRCRWVFNADGTEARVVLPIDHV
jgi:two-component sensor histidine kinase